MIQIGQGKLMLIGTKSSFGGIYQGPWYYYLFLPIFKIGAYRLNAILYFNALLFALSSGYFFFRVAEATNKWKATLTTLALVLSACFLLPSRSPGNAFSYIPFLLIILTVLALENYRNNRKSILVLGLLSGLVVNFHYATLLVIIPLAIFLLLTIDRKKNFWLFLTAFVFTFVPLGLFEIRHNFVMIRNTFIDKSYLSFMENTNIPQTVPLKRNFIENMGLYSNKIGRWIVVPPFIYAIAVLGIGYLSKLKKREFIFYGLSLSTWPLLAFILRSQITSHYFLPFSMVIFVASLLVIIKTRFAWVISLIIVAEVLTFPSSLYQDSSRKYDRYEATVNKAVSNNLIQRNENFNVIQYRNKSFVNPVGYEYRFFLRKMGYQMRSEFEYNQSDVLYLFSEDANLDTSTLESWEIGQFGKERLSNPEISDLGGITLFKFK